MRYRPQPAAIAIIAGLFLLPAVGVGLCRNANELRPLQGLLVFAGVVSAVLAAFRTVDIADDRLSINTAFSSRHIRWDSIVSVEMNVLRRIVIAYRSGDGIRSIEIAAKLYRRDLIQQIAARVPAAPISSRHES